MQGKNIQSFTFEDMLDNLRQGKNFSYSRFGDGEFACILGKTGCNTDRHTYFPDLGQRLKQILESSPSYYLGLQNLAVRIYNDNEEFQRLVEMNNWVDNEIIHHQNGKGRMGELFEAMKDRYVILVGNETLRNIPFKYEAFVEIPRLNCWLDYERIREELDDLREPGCVILYCASMMSNVLTHSLFNLAITQIDMGSSLDPHVNILSRRYHKDMKL